jgi:hypothetical protein
MLQLSSRYLKKEADADSTGCIMYVNSGLDDIRRKYQEASNTSENPV